MSTDDTVASLAHRIERIESILHDILYNELGYTQNEDLSRIACEQREAQETSERFRRYLMASKPEVDKSPR